jgi:hypothetical protein
VALGVGGAAARSSSYRKSHDNSCGSKNVYLVCAVTVTMACHDTARLESRTEIGRVVNGQMNAFQPRSYATFDGFSTAGSQP